MPVIQPAGAMRTIGTQSYTDAIFSSDGSRLYAESGNTVSVIDVATGSTITQYTVGTNLAGMDLSPDGHYLVVAEGHTGTSASLYRIDLTSGAITTYSLSLGTSQGAFFDVAVLSDGTALVSQTSFGSTGAPLRLLNFSTSQFTIAGGSGSAASAIGQATLTASIDHSHVFIDSYGYQTTSLLYVQGSGIVAHTDPYPYDPYAGAAMPSLDGENVQATSPDGSLYVDGRTLNVYDSSLHVVGTVPFAGSGMAFSADGHTLYVASNDLLAAVDTSTWQITGIYRLGASSAGAGVPSFVGYGDIVQASSDGHTVSIIGSTGVQLVDVSKAIFESTQGPDTISGSGQLFGLGGNDDLTGVGYTWMSGGPGDDVYHVNSENQYVVENPGEGHDTIHSTVSFAMDGAFSGANVEDLVLEGTQDIYGYGNDLDNNLVGNSGANILSGGAGNDHLSGNDGNDNLDGGAGNDALDGGAGSDTATYSSSTAGVTVSLAITGAQDTVGAGTDTLINIENLTGSWTADHLTGNAANNVIDDGGASAADVMTGGAGDDTYRVHNPLDVITELAGSGHDTVLAETNFTIPVNVEEMTMVGGEFTGTGNELDNILNGDDSANTLLGAAGNDTINGGSGSETLAGGAGADTINGGAGDDQIYGGDVSPPWSVPAFSFNYELPTSPPLLDRGSDVDVLNGGAGVDTISAGYGDIVDGGADAADLLISLAGSSSGLNVDFRALDNGGTLSIGGGQISNIRSVLWIEGSNFDDTIYGSNQGGPYGSNAAPIFGLGGNDHIIAGQDTGNIYGGDGNDVIEAQQAYTATSFTPAYYGDAGDDTITVTGNGVLYPHAAIFGGDGNDVLTGAGYISGGSGNDRITVLSNAETLSTVDGGAGNDVIVGSALVDYLSGGANDDLLTGGAGTDSLTGGAGNDTFKDTTAGLSGDTITDLSVGDSILITDATLSGFTFSLSGTKLTFTGGSLTLGTVPAGTIVAHAVAGGGVQLTVQVLAHHAAANDFNGDGRSDILWRNDSSGQIVDWLGITGGGFNGNAAHSLNTVAADFQVAGTGDFNGDGRVDILWRSSSTGQIVDWLGTSNGGFAGNGAHSNNSVATSIHVAGVGDFNGDGRSDILWMTDAGRVVDWLGTSTGGFAGNAAHSDNVVAAGWSVASIGDFNGDGMSDVLWQNGSRVIDWLGTATGGFAGNGANSTGFLGAGWSVAGTGDFNGDSRDDILLTNSSTGQVTEWLGMPSGGFSDNSVHALATLPTGFQIAQVGDFNGDGIDDVLLRNNSTGQITDWLGNPDGSGAFIDNTVHAAATVATAWHVEPQHTALL